MKKHIRLVPARSANFFRSLVLVACLVATTAPTLVQAQDTLNTSPRVTVRHALPIAGLPVFSVSIEKETPGTFDLYISDEDGTVLYTERIKGQHYAKRFQLESADLQATKLVVKVVGKNAGDTQIFHVNRALGIVEASAVTRQ